MMMVNGVRYHIEQCGNGFPALLLHGFTGDFTTWAPFCEQWGRHSKLIVPDIIGHGKTEAPEDVHRYSIEAAAVDLKYLIDFLGIEKVDLVGYSMGGRLALTFAILYPERVSSLILESSSPGLQSKDAREQRRISDRKLADFIREQGIESFVDYWEEIPLFTTMKRLPLEIRETIRQQRLRNNPTGLVNSLLGMGTGSQPSWWDELTKLTCEVLLITGKEDEKFSAIAAKMMKSLKHGNWIEVANVGHAIHVEDSEKFGTIISDFLCRNKQN
ncbi:2-succinyl-6-hydroxy-2,4-cyclohexadiene-1-carboxylate synthase [Bacillus rubiinfantis]|uniref:2-succinyl-6-hydroxy-2, 4-cyclohexadiene-1-carboxylate synthase n=1 Tax=Bacillus rubiinfantis TaxID=1499680 RepID=UPI0005AA1AE0|nr:2-succinyl-6-hydroxy-2,4-cyclohexadiene-1-carboxylate synthase [Bacillus rubiinfantis]